MNHINLRRILGAAVAAGLLSLAACMGATQPQAGHDGGMMRGMDGYGWMGGDGGPWMLILLVAIAALLIWIIARGRNRR